jgi:hypothetical protein
LRNVFEVEKQIENDISKLEELGFELNISTLKN